MMLGDGQTAVGGGLCFGSCQHWVIVEGAWSYNNILALQCHGDVFLDFAILSISSNKLLFLFDTDKKRGKKLCNVYWIFNLFNSLNYITKKKKTP